MVAPTAKRFPKRHLRRNYEPCEIVSAITERLRSMNAYGYQSQLACEAADMLEAQAQRMALQQVVNENLKVKNDQLHERILSKQACLILSDAAVTELQAENAELRKDAERYRFIRSQGELYFLDENLEWYEVEDDDAVDRAMKEQSC
jgi:hypothetical protein